MTSVIDYIDLTLTMRSKTTFGTDTDTIRVWAGQDAAEVAESKAHSYGAQVVSLANLDGTPYPAPEFCG